MNRRTWVRWLDFSSDNRKSKIQNLKWGGIIALVVVFALCGAVAHAAQRELQKLTVGYTPVSGAALPFFVAVEEKLFQKHGLEISPVFMGGSPADQFGDTRR
jgi:ABC-type nitrate/sulfonate/bicarbonate transport system substrate-binding protein